MHITIIAPVPHLRLSEDCSTIDINGIVISSNTQPIFDTLSQRELISIGGFELEPFSIFPYIYYQGEAESFILYQKGESISRLLKRTHEYFSLLLSKLWHVKDCSIFIPHCYAFVSEVPDESSSNLLSTFLSNSQGLYSGVEFNKKEIETYLDINRQLGTIKFPSSKSQPDLYKDESPTNVGSANSTSYNDYSRITRSLLFLQIARSNSFLPLKLTFYAAIFECLFTTDNSAVNHKISERAAYYLSNDKKERIEIFKFIKKIYDVRSKYVHGQEIDKDVSERSKMLPLCQRADDLTRTLLNRVIYAPEPFLLENNKLIEWFNELLF